MKGLIGKKLGMTRVFDENGRSIPVTVLQCGPCPITQVKTDEKEGYSALQLGFGEDSSEKHLTMPQRGHLAKAGAGPMRVLREFRVDSTEGFELGQTLKVDIFEGIDRVNVTGITKGRGFAGVVKRHGYGGGKETHGSHHHRHPGTIGMCATPARVFKGHKLPGRYGTDRMTVTNMQVVRIDAENDLIFVRGAVPGSKNGYILVQEPRR
jgi:large subunit ribosomal protein L3